MRRVPLLVLLLALLGLLLLAYLGCGKGSDVCGPGNCIGCCSNNACTQPGTILGQGYERFCGANGGACSACSDTQACRSGSCVARVLATMKYDYKPHAGCDGSSPMHCSVAKLLAPDDFLRAAALFPSCNISEASHTIDCSGQCTFYISCWICPCFGSGIDPCNHVCAWNPTITP